MLPRLHFILYTKHMVMNKRRNIVLGTLTAVIIGITAIAALTYQEPQTLKNNYDDKIVITTTTGHIADLVKNVAGDHAIIKSLMGPGTDPHLYKPVRSDIVKLYKADIIFYNGRHLEGQMSSLFEQMEKKKPAIGLAYSINNLITDKAGVFDPHIWMDVENWIEATDIVVKELSDLSPENKESFEKSALEYKNKLKALDNYIRVSVQSIPEQNRVLITAHDAFGYLGSAYGIEVIGVQGLSTTSEAGLFEIESLVQRISKDNIPAIFSESSVSDQNIRAIKEGVISRGHDLVSGGTLYSDSLGKHGSGADTYIGMMKSNIQTIAKALGGKIIDDIEYKEAQFKQVQ